MNNSFLGMMTTLTTVGKVAVRFKIMIDSNSDNGFEITHLKIYLQLTKQYHNIEN